MVDIGLFLRRWRGGGGEVEVARRALIEPLEERRLLSATMFDQASPLLFVSDNTRLLAVAQPAAVARTAIVRPAMKGAWFGALTVPGDGTYPVTLKVTTQTATTIKGSFTNLYPKETFTARVTYPASGQFRSVIKSPVGNVILAGKVVRSKMTGSLTGKAENGATMTLKFTLVKRG